MEQKTSYLGKVAGTIKSLATGLSVTMKEFFTPKVTEQYPENRKTLKISDRHRAMLYMPLDEDGNNRCIACGLCQSNCPNGTITIKTRTVVDEETGKSKKVLDSASSHGAELIVTACPLCRYNLEKNGESEMPVVYFTELLAEALGVKEG